MFFLSLIYVKRSLHWDYKEPLGQIKCLQLLTCVKPQVFVTTLISLTVYTAPDQTGNTPGQHLTDTLVQILKQLFCAVVTGERGNSFPPGHRGRRDISLSHSVVPSGGTRVYTYVCMYVLWTPDSTTVCHHNTSGSHPVQSKSCSRYQLLIIYVTKYGPNIFLHIKMAT